MRLVPLFVLVLSFTAACDKKKEGDAAPPGGAAAPADPVAKSGDPAAVKPEEKKAEAPKPPEPPKPAEKTGVLDTELQQVEGGWKVLTPRVSAFFTTKPSVQRQDAQTPFGDTIPGAIAMVEGNDRFGGLIYIPIPKDLPYDVPKGLKGARDGMLGMFDPGYTAKDEKTKLGPFDANHVIADGRREGHNFHVEAWIAYDDTAHAVYGLMALRMPGDLAGLDTLKDGFKLREDAVVADKEEKKDDKAAKPVEKKAAPNAPKKAPAADEKF